MDNWKYDAFISYSNTEEDRTWVHFTLVPELEKKYGFKLYIHHRDFIGGRDIADNIEDAIRQSRKVVGVISPDFMTSNWCCTEMQMTSTIDKNKIVFVKYRDVPSSIDVPFHVAYLLGNRTYIDYNENDLHSSKLFWKRLVKALFQID